MNLSKNINHILLLMLLYETLIEAKPKKPKKTTIGKSTKSKHKRKKQFFPAGNAGYPSPYPFQQLNPTSPTEVKFVKGFPPSYDCTSAKYGCCWDGRTPAHGKAGKGCPPCRDVYADFCHQTKNLCHFPMIADYCRITCKLCSKKKNSCQKSKYNCCWDGVTLAKGVKCKDCPKIKDKLDKECEKFEAECLRNPYFMWTKCRATCLRNLPPIQPFLQQLTPSSGQRLGLSLPQGQFGMPPPLQAVEELSYPHPFPGMSQKNRTFPLRKKTSAMNSKKQNG